MRRLIIALTLCVTIVAIPEPARADATAFVGVTTTPSSRAVRGFSGGFSLIIIGFEFEYAQTSEDEEEGAPSLRTGMGNVLLQTPSLGSFQIYGTTGGGLFRERLGTAQETHLGVNTGGGVKITLAGPLRARIDYRLFKLGGTPLHSQVQRLYAGVTLAF